VYNQEEVDFLRRNAAANEKNANKQKIKEGIFQRKEFFFSLLLLNNESASTKKRSNTFRSNNNRSLNDDDDKMTTLMQMPDGRLIRKY
jgi:hypothetical protein